MNTTTNTIKTFETVHALDYPRAPGETEHRDLLNTLLTSEAASRLIDRIVNDGTTLAKLNLRKCSGDAWSYAAADLHAMAFELYFDGDLTELHDYVAADYVIKRITERVFPAVCTPKGLELLRWLLRDNARAIVNLAVRQQELGWSH